MANWEDIKDRESLEAWLQGRPREVAVSLAARAALRVMPVWAVFCETDAARKRELTPLPVLRAGLISAVAAVSPTAEIRAAAFAADSAAAAFAAASAAFAADSASAADSAASAADSAASAAESAAFAADSADSAAAAALWDAIRADAQALENGGPIPGGRLWPDANPLQSQWDSTRARWSEPGSPYDFWRRWYESVLAGEPMNPEMLYQIALIPNDTWDAGPEAVADAIREIEAGFARPPSISEAAFTDFRFDAIHYWMVMVEFEDDLEHLRDEKVLQAFLDDCEDLKDDLEDFIDYALTEMRGRNNAVRMVTSAEKLLKELKRAEDGDRLRARRFIKLGRDAEIGAAIEADRARVKEPNAQNLDAAIDAFRAICRKHLAPVLRRMEPLRGIEFGDADPKKLVKDLATAIATLKDAKAHGLKPLDPDAQVAFDELLDGMENLESMLAEAQSEERRDYLKKRFSEQYAGSVATVRRLYEKTAPYADGAAKVVDRASKNVGRFQKLVEWWEWITSLPGGGAG